MLEIYKILIGLVVLLLGFILGKFLAKVTKDELKEGQIWFKLIILVSLIGAIVSLIVGSDVLFFTFLFFMIVTSSSLKKKR